MLLSGRLPTALQFQVSLKHDSSASLATWHIQIPSKTITELSVHRSNHQETGGDLEGASVPPDWGELMLMYSWLTLVFTQSGGRSTIVFQLGAHHEEEDLRDTKSTPAGQWQHQPTAKHRQLKLPQISAGTNASQLLLNWLILPVFHGMVKFSIGWSGFPQEDW